MSCLPRKLHSIMKSSTYEFESREKPHSICWKPQVFNSINNRFQFAANASTIFWPCWQRSTRESADVDVVAHMKNVFGEIFRANKSDGWVLSLAAEQFVRVRRIRYCKAIKFVNFREKMMPRISETEPGSSTQKLCTLWADRGV